MKNYLFLAGCLFAAACNNDQKTSTDTKIVKDSTTAQTTTAPATPNTATFTLLNFDKKDTPLKDSVKGTIINGATWKDADGEQQVLLTETDNVEKDGTQNKQLYAYCFIKNSEGWKKKWLVQDRIEACEVDATCEFFPESLSVADVDHNNIGEASFIYKTSCKGDVSPHEKKLIMYEGLNKYAMRGSTILQTMQGKEGGTKKIDAALSSASKALLDHANSQWDKFGLEKY